MNQDKYNKNEAPENRPSNKRKANILFISLILLFVCGVGTTMAYLTDTPTAVTNIFNPATVSCEVTEDPFTGLTKTNVAISNTGSAEAYIRAAIVVTWKDAENGNVYGSKPVLGTDYTMELNLTDWFMGDDGYYYYIKPVAPKGETGYKKTVLIKNCTVNQTNTPEGYGLNVEILGSAIQSVPISVVNEKWPAVEATTAHGNLSKK